MIISRSWGDILVKVELPFFFFWKTNTSCLTKASHLCKNFRYEFASKKYLQRFISFSVVRSSNRAKENKPIRLTSFQQPAGAIREYHESASMIYADIDRQA